MTETEKPMRVQENFQCDEELKLAIIARCKKDRISKSALIRQVLSRELEKELTQNLVAVTE